MFLTDGIEAQNRFLRGFHKIQASHWSEHMEEKVLNGWNAILGTSR